MFTHEQIPSSVVSSRCSVLDDTGSESGDENPGAEWHVPWGGDGAPYDWHLTGCRRLTYLAITRRTMAVGGQDVGS